MPEAKAAIVILNFNGVKLLKRFLGNVIRHSAPYPVIVADNNSTDGSLDMIRSEFPEVRVLTNSGNFGYAKGYNVALAQLEADYFVLMNNDVEVREGWLLPLLEVMEKDPRIAACQPKLLDLNSPEAFEYAGASGGYIDRYGYPFCRGRMFNSLEKDHGQYNDCREIFWASGACLAIRTSGFIEAGGFDDDYFAHMEEIDLCWRLKNLGYRIVVEPRSIAYHLGGGTLSKSSPHKTFLNFRNNLSTFLKNHPARGLLIKILYRLLLDGIAGLKFLLGGSFTHCVAVLKAHYAFYKNIPALLRKRNHMKAKNGFHFSLSCIYDGNIVIEHFIRKKNRFSDLKRGFLPGKKQANKSDQPVHQN